MSSHHKLGTSAQNGTPKYVARYIENFIDLVENVPNDLSRRISRVHEMQLDYETSLTKLESNLTRFSKKQNSNDQQKNDDVRQLKLLLATQHCLIRMQEISDNKLAIIQDALDQLDNKSRELDHDLKLINAATEGGGDTNNKNNKSNNTNKNQSTSSSSQPKTSTREEPEPTYCICHQVSYGDMICCDNDACDIEWFHFQCVALTSKPKGKWYCPKCRGDRSNQLKK